MIGNHRDAWVYGAADPVSGSAVMTEIVRVLGSYKKDQKFRPRRSIMICSWGAEEAGMQGSTEWTDENAKFLTQKVILRMLIQTYIKKILKRKKSFPKTNCLKDLYAEMYVFFIISFL